VGARKPRQPRGAFARVRGWMPAGLLEAPYELGFAPRFIEGERLSDTVKRSARFGARKAALPLGPTVAKGVLDALALLGPEALPFVAGGHGAVDAIDRATRANRGSARRNGRVTKAQILAELARRGPQTSNELADNLGVFPRGGSDRDSAAFRHFDRQLYAMVLRSEVRKTGHSAEHDEPGDEYHLPGNPPRRNGGPRRKRHASTRSRARGRKRSPRHRARSSTLQSLPDAAYEQAVVGVPRHR